MYYFKLLKRTQNRSEVGPYENLEFVAMVKDSQEDDHVFARMESDSLSSLETEDTQLTKEFEAFLDKNYDVLHYYMD